MKGRQDEKLYDREWLKAARKAMKKTQTDVAEAVGIKKIYYCKLEKGYNKPGVMVAFAMGDYLDFDARKFYEEKEIEPVEMF